MEQIWVKVLDLVKMDIKGTSYQRWFTSILSVKRQGNYVYISVPDEYAQEYMTEAFSALLQDCFYKVSGERLFVQFVNGDIEEDSLYGQHTINEYSFSQEETNIPNNHGFIPRYTFDSFVVGNSNRFAHAAAMSVAERPARTYNPLFIYGGSGLGKTHLMHAIGQQVLKQSPNAKVVYVSTESFTNEFISLVRMGKAHTFKNLYRNAEVFLIDDIQFLTGKEGTQEEFFHTFNALHNQNKQIVISSDRPPKEIEMLEERLRSRFEWGLITDIQAPDLETRCAILQQKAFFDKFIISDTAIFYIADKIHSNIRELEGALNKVMHFAALNHIDRIEVDHIKEALRGILPEEKKVQLSIELIQNTVAEYFHLPVFEMKSQKRDRHVSYPRQIAMYICRELLDASLPKIGHEFGGRDHTTVIHACDKINSSLPNNPSLEKTLTDLYATLKG